ncbi:MAG: pyrroloquinoline quinone-dependent dehydrogenase [Pseudomonadota bacterium]|nr:pyrroloquinoline quinone-dependent dehydrogenase [Pseudomonadota bacterium]MEC9458513.1 pyrroloquinoline quinone-dependent dehydrogenase [Pseudomonadota bacterium]
MKNLFLFLIIILFSFQITAQVDDWTAYGKGSGGGHYSKASEITPENVHNLERAWVHRSGDFQDGANTRGTISNEIQTSFQATPLLVDETLYYCTPFNRVFALNPETGEEKWIFDPEVDPAGRPLKTCRGLSSWKDSSKSQSDICYHRIVGVTMDVELFSIDGKTGKLCNDFGDKGIVNLRKGLGDHPDTYYWSSSPPAIIGEKLIVGGSVIDNLSIHIPGGVVRAYDIRTGELIWYWDPIPPGKEAVLDDDGNHLYQRGTANVWSIISTDPDLNLIYLPTGNASPDYYGGHRKGLDYYNSSVVALNADTGEVAWHFKTVYHDVWDYDVPSQPTFYDVEKDGKTIKALAQTTKMGLVFLLNRETGEPIFPIEEREVPQGSLEGENLSKTQPFPTKPAPLNPTYFDPEDAYGFTFWDRGYCKRTTEKLRNEGLYTPPSLEGSIHYPSAIGGNNWGGPAVDHSRNVMVVNTMNLASLIVMIPREDCNKPLEELAINDTQARFTSIEQNEGIPYCNLRSMGFFSPLGVPCTEPPWGTLTGIDLNSGEHLWNVPLGTSKDIAPFPFWWIKGAPNMGGPTVTASGVTFIAATSDYYLRAFNTETGEELAKFRLPTGGHATPMTYTNKDGRQFVVIAAGGHWAIGTPASDHLIAYALPENK